MAIPAPLTATPAIGPALVPVAAPVLYAVPRVGPVTVSALRKAATFATMLLLASLPVLVSSGSASPEAYCFQWKNTDGPLELSTTDPR
jgi:hypothetical protein